MTVAGARLPDAIIIGAPRSGTTALFAAVRQHPDVHPAPQKEMRFFDKHYERGLDWYAEQFAAALPHQVTIEATPWYMGSAVAMERIARDLPQVALVAVLRDPCERANSNYWYSRSRGADLPSLEQVVEDEIAGRPGARRFLALGRYAEQLDRIDGLGLPTPLTLWFDDIDLRSEQVLAEVFRHLGVDPAAGPSAIAKVNANDRFRSLRLRRVARRLPGPLKGMVGRINRVEREQPPLPTALRERMLSVLTVDIERLQARTGRDLSAWLSAAP
jgi:hypothetical protein